MSKELDDAYFRSTHCTYYEPLLSKLVDCVDLLEERIKGLLGAKVYVGDTDTLPAGSEAMVSASKHGYDTMLEFGIPSGKDGSDAEATDVRIAGKSITTDGVADIPAAKPDTLGLFKSQPDYGFYYGFDNNILIQQADSTKIDARSNSYQPITPANLDYAVKAAMTDGKGASWTADEQKVARERMNAADANKVYIMQKQIENLQGIAATEETDSTEAYTKTVPTGAQKWASLDSIGGKTVVNDGELVSAEVVEVESNGKNLLDFSTANANVWNVRMIPNPFKSGETYTVSAKEQPADNSRGFKFYLSRTGMETDKLLTNSYIGKQFSATETFTAPDDCGDYPYLNLAGSTKGVGLEYESFNLMAERGTIATAYSPYGVKGTFPIPQSVREMCPGYGWSAGTACNEIDFGRKVYVQRVSSVDLGTLVYWNESTDVSGKYRFSSDTVKDIKPNTQNVFTKDLRYNGNTYNYVDGIEISTQGVIYICDSRYETAVDFKAAMQGVLLYYELAEPIEVDLSGVLPDDHYIEVEAGGTVTFKQTSTQLPVPSSVTYQISTSEVIANA